MLRKKLQVASGMSYYEQNKSYFPTTSDSWQYLTHMIFYFQEEEEENL